MRNEKSYFALELCYSLSRLSYLFYKKTPPLLAPSDYAIRLCHQTIAGHTHTLTSSDKVLKLALKVWVTEPVFLQLFDYAMFRDKPGGRTMKLSEQIRKTILASEKTRYAIAVGSGIDHAVLRRFMRGERDIKLRTAEQLAEYLGLELVQKKKAKVK